MVLEELVEFRNAEVRVLQTLTSTQTIHCAMRCEQLPLFFYVAAKLCTVATNFLKFCMAGSARLALALAAGVFGVNCAAGEGSM